MGIEGRVHFLHIGKTGGSSIKFVLRRCKTPDNMQFHLHNHPVTLIDIPQGERFFFCVRDPIKRFVSGFYSRKRQGQPRYNIEWSETEKNAFGEFNAPNELAEALSSKNVHARTAAFKAMRGIQHVKNGYWQWFGNPSYLQKRLPDLLFVCRQENLNNDFHRLKELLGLPADLLLPSDTVKAHVNTFDDDKHLSSQAVDNLSKWYAPDYGFMDLLKKKGLISVDRIV